SRRQMGWSYSKLVRIETGRASIGIPDLHALLRHYGAGQDKITTMVELARSAREQAPWNLYRDVASPVYVAFCSYESSASVIRNFEPIFVPGLLQIEEYARAVIRFIEDSRYIDGLVDLRMQRQELLTQPHPPRMHFILDESVICRHIGGVTIMRRQLQ